MKLLMRCWKIFDGLLGFLAGIGMVLLTLMMLAVCWEVVTRYFLGKGTIWVIEFSEYTMLYMTFLGTAWLLRKEGHVEMDIVTITLSLRAQRILKIGTSVVAGLLCIVLMWSGAEVALDHLMRGLHQPTLLAPPDFPLFAIIPVGFFLLSIQFLRRAYNHLVVKELKEEKERVMV